MSKKIGLIGYFGYSVKNPIIGGQMSKTRGIYTEIIKRYGKENVVAIDTSNWKKENCKLFLKMLKVASTCNPIIVMPNKKGIKVILPLYAALKPIFHYAIAYPVVGGWLTGLLKKHKYLSNSIKAIDYILPETKALADELKEFVKCKIEVMPIFSLRSPVNPGIIRENYNTIKRFCTFSRVIPEKGIDEAIEAIAGLNSDEKKCHLDIWGPIDNKYSEHYKEIFNLNKDHVTYRGVLGEDDGLDILAQYYMLLFPTYYPGEGFPTTICESFMAALPVIATNWRFNSELIKNGKTGYLVSVHDTEQLKERILYAISHEQMIINMKNNVLKKSYDFTPEVVTKDLLCWIDEHL